MLRRNIVECLPKTRKLTITQLEQGYICKDKAEEQALDHLVALQSAVAAREAESKKLTTGDQP